MREMVFARVLNYSDVIDSRISPSAQHALVRLSKNPTTSPDATGMLEEIKAGRLGGIYCVNWKAAALRAQKLGTSWWTVIPPGQDAVLMTDPANLDGGQPLIAFRRELDSDCGLFANEKRFAAAPGRLDAALLRGWSSYRVLRQGGLLRCDQPVTAERLGVRSASAHLRPVSNVIPPIFCQLDDTLTVCDDKLPDVCSNSNDKTRVFSCKVVDKTRKITFEFCWTTLAFNPRARGEVDFNSATKRITFSCHRAEVGANCKKGLLNCIPAWDYEAVVIAHGPGLPNAADWEVGFLQTVRTSRWAGLYSGGTATVCDIRDTRDELRSGNPPWVMPSAVVGLCGGTNPTFTDSPFARFACKHPRSIGETLRQVCFKGTFDIWLAAKRKKDKPTPNNFVLLGFKQIKVDRTWQRDADSDPCSAAWKHFGGQAESSQRCGPLLPAPVLTGDSANMKAATCFKDTKGVSCATPDDNNSLIIGGDCVPEPGCRV